MEIILEILSWIFLEILCGALGAVIIRLFDRSVKFSDLMTSKKAMFVGLLCWVIIFVGVYLIKNG